MASIRPRTTHNTDYYRTGPNMSDNAEIDAVAAAHQFRSTSISRNGINTLHAGCSCESVRFDWYGRDAQHRAHLLAEVYAAGQASVIPPAVAASTNTKDTL